MTFKEWITNPSGKGSAVMSAKEMYKERYSKKLNLIMLREGNKYNYTLYKSKDQYTYYIHMKIPSEVIKNFYYDIVIEFSTTNPAYSVGNSLDKYDIKVFSNSPDFTFIHTHAYNKAGLLFTDLSSKLPKESITTVAKERNPKDEIGYVKAIYFAYLIMTQKGLFNKAMYVMAQTYSKRDVLDKVMHASQKIQLRQEAEAKIKAEERKKKSLEIRQANEKRNVEKTVSKSVSSAAVRYTGKTKYSSMTKTVKKK